MTVALRGSSHQERLLAAKRARRDELELKEARYGINLPVQDAVELAELRREIEELEKPLRSPISEEVVEALGPAGQFQSLMLTLDQIRRGLSEQIDRDQEALWDRFSERITQEEETRLAWQDEERRERRRHQQRRTTWLIIVTIALMVLALVIAVTTTIVLMQ